MKAKVTRAASDRFESGLFPAAGGLQNSSFALPKLPEKVPQSLFLRMAKHLHPEGYLSRAVALHAEAEREEGEGGGGGGDGDHDQGEEGGGGGR